MALFPPIEHDAYVTNKSELSEAESAWETRLIKQFFLCSILIAVILVTIIGNLMVIVAILLVPRLRRPENLLILNLAFADELVATLVMPVALVYEGIFTNAWAELDLSMSDDHLTCFLCGIIVMPYWPFGSFMCDLWISIDITTCSASILSLCVISLDRYFVISRPLQYGPKRTSRRMALSVLGVWLLSSIISVPPLFYFGNQTTERRCFVSQEPVYQIYATITAFYAPVIVMIIAYAKIYQAARRISEDEKHFMYIQPIRRISERKIPLQGTAITRLIVPGVTVTQPLLEKPSAPSGNYARTTSTYYSRELKAFRTITAIAVAFLVSWLPFFILALIRPYYDGIPKWCTALTLWLGYFNSTVNPVLYSIFNKDFRRPFAELLRCRCWSLRKIIRAETYEAQFGTQASIRSKQHWSRVKCPSPESGREDEL